MTADDLMRWMQWIMYGIDVFLPFLFIWVLRIAIAERRRERQAQQHG